MATLHQGVVVAAQAMQGMFLAVGVPWVSALSRLFASFQRVVGQPQLRQKEAPGALDGWLGGRQLPLYH